MDKRFDVLGNLDSVQRKPKCFVAMAFGRPDTDAVYNLHISKAIRDVGMIPVRVDKIIHNERIDFKIRSLIQNANVVVADLTYARPSAYWEAGYAERAVPVVYTCRADHLHPHPNDQLGNLQVHFDLKNANLITWSGNGNSQFREKLKKTLFHVTRGLRIDLEKEAQLRVEREKFFPLSAKERNKLIYEEAGKVLTKQGYKELGHTFSGKDKSHSSAFYTEVNGRVLYSLYLKKIGSTAVFVLRLPCIGVLTQAELKNIIYQVAFDLDVYNFALWGDLPGKIKKLFGKKIHSIRRIMLSHAIAKVPHTRIEKIFPYWRRVGIKLHYFNPQIDVPPYIDKSRRKGDKIVMPSSGELLVVSGIESALEYRETLADAIRGAENENVTIIYPSNHSTT